MFERNFSGLPRRVDVLLGSMLTVREVSDALDARVQSLPRHGWPGRHFVGVRGKNGWHIHPQRNLFGLFPPIDISLTTTEDSTHVHVALKPAEHFEAYAALMPVVIPLLVVITFGFIHSADELSDGIIRSVAFNTCAITAIAIVFYLGRTRFESKLESEINYLSRELDAYRLTETRILARADEE